MNDETEIWGAKPVQYLFPLPAYVDMDARLRNTNLFLGGLCNLQLQHISICVLCFNISLP